MDVDVAVAVAAEPELTRGEETQQTVVGGGDGALVKSELRTGKRLIRLTQVIGKEWLEFLSFDGVLVCDWLLVYFYKADWADGLHSIRQELNWMKRSVSTDRIYLSTRHENV